MPEIPEDNDARSWAADTRTAPVEKGGQQLTLPADEPRRRAR